MESCYITIDKQELTKWQGNSTFVFATIPARKVKVICPKGVRKEFLNPDWKAFNQRNWKVDPLNKIQKFSQATPAQNFEFLQFSHPCEKFGERKRAGWRDMECDKKELHRSEMLEYWEANGKMLFTKLGMPDDKDYPYINIHAGSIMPFGEKSQWTKDDWEIRYWDVLSNNLPISPDYIEQEIKNKKEIIAFLKELQTAKYDLKWEIGRKEDDIEVLENYLKKNKGIKQVSDPQPKIEIQKPETTSKTPTEKKSKSVILTDGKLQVEVEYIKSDSGTYQISKKVAKSLLKSNKFNDDKWGQMYVTDDLNDDDPYWIFIEDTKNEEEYDNLDDGKYIILVPNEKIKTSVPKASSVKKDIEDALTGAKAYLKYATDKEKTDIKAYIRGLEILLK